LLSRKQRAIPQQSSSTPELISGLYKLARSPIVQIGPTRQLQRLALQPHGRDACSLSAPKFASHWIRFVSQRLNAEVYVLGHDKPPAN
jgi:hypothetical protein